VVLGDVLLVDGEGGLKIGKALEGTQVDGMIVRQLRDKKVLVFKKQRRKNYRRKHGHRQNLTELKITGIHQNASAVGGGALGA
jgi:large subunit ribosomal protein L21